MTVQNVLYDYTNMYSYFKKVGEWQWPAFVALPASVLWTPKFELMNCNVDRCSVPYVSSSTASGNRDYGHELLVVNSDGSVEWLTPQRLQTTCDMKFDYFPFDEQRCEASIIQHTSISTLEFRGLV